MLLRLMTTTGKFQTVATHECQTQEDADRLVQAHADAAGMSCVKPVADFEETGLRYTATTKGGRRGRNIAFLDF